MPVELPDRPRSILRLVSREEFAAREVEADEQVHESERLGPPLSDYLDSIYAVENERLASGSPLSLSEYRTQVRNLERYWRELHQGSPPPLRIGHCTTPLLAAAKKWQLDAGRSPETANKLGRTIQAIVNHAIEREELDLKPLKVKRFRSPRRKPQAWQPAKILDLLQVARSMPGLVGPVPAGQWHFAHLCFILSTGLRINAAMFAPSSRLDLDAAWFSMPADHQKDKEEIGFDLPDVTVAALRAITPHRNEWIFGDWPYGRKPLPQRSDWRSLNLRLKQMLVRAGLVENMEANFRKDLWHKLRRCFATLVAMEHGQAIAQELLGHSHPSVTKGYLDESQLRKTRVAPALNAHLKLPPPDRQIPLFDL